LITPFSAWLVDILMRSGDIRDQSLKLSKIAKNFGLFLPSQILGKGGAGPKMCTQIVIPALRYVTWKSFVRLLILATKIITVNTLNFKPISECSFF